MTLNMLRYLLCALTVAAEAGYSLSPSALLEIFNVCSTENDSGYFAIYPIPNQGLLGGFPGKDDDWQKKVVFCQDKLSFGQ